MKEKAVIFGASGTAKRVYEMVKNDYEILCFVDNDEEKWGTKFIEELDIQKPNKFIFETCDAIIIATIMGLEEVSKQLEKMNIPVSKIRKNYTEISVKSRISFLKRFSELIYSNEIDGAVAEAGVFRGEFAKEINHYFYDRKCYLFDTFEGFNKNDFKYEMEKSYTDATHFKNTSQDFVYEKMPNKNMIAMKCGYFPQTTKGIEDIFCFVNLDMDLYQPTLEGLRFFYPKLESGGVILVHDYFSEIYPNIKKALKDYENEIGYKLHSMPIGDDFSIAILK